LRLAYWTVANTFAVLRLLPMTDREKDAEILVLGHQIAVLGAGWSGGGRGSPLLTGRYLRHCCTGRLLGCCGGCGCCAAGHGPALAP
jgi:hypothetical protein